MWQSPWDAGIQVLQFVVAEADMDNDGQVGLDPHRMYSMSVSLTEVVLHLKHQFHIICVCILLAETLM